MPSFSSLQPVGVCRPLVPHQRQGQLQLCQRGFHEGQHDEGHGHNAGVSQVLQRILSEAPRQHLLLQLRVCVYSLLVG